VPVPTVKTAMMALTLLALIDDWVSARVLITEAGVAEKVWEISEIGSNQLTSSKDIQKRVKR
jgi:hypothetical protein